VLGAPHAATLELRFHGRPAHSGIAPEEGRSAIAAASRAIADLRLGRIDEETTANVGVIAGGTARNIIPEWCTVKAEARSHDERKLADLVQEMLDAAAFAAGVGECELEARSTAAIGATASVRGTGPSSSPARRSSGPATALGSRSAAAAPTRTCSTSAAFRA
jgi:metal-dependent amidase/aminoacylase/carboxypeptidase family protein